MKIIDMIDIIDMITIVTLFSISCCIAYTWLKKLIDKHDHFNRGDSC